MYKNGTKALINWLVLRGLTADRSRNPTSTRLPVRQILELAESIAQKPLLPLKPIKDAFNVVLVNRRRLTQYYEENEDSWSVATAEATARHKHFNDIPAQTYELLFPRVDLPVKPHKPAIVHSVQLDETQRSNTSHNRFDVLSELIEHEPEFEETVPWVSSSTTNDPVAEPSAIEDDPLEEVIALHAYILEVESTISKIRDIWACAARGDIHVALAGWLNNFSFQMI
jgi:hypothetical protein